MKNILTKFPSRLKTFFVVVLVIAGFFAIQKTHTSQAQTVQDYPESSNNLISRVGSLVLSPTISVANLSASFINTIYAARCERGTNTASAIESCLDVRGSGIFAGLFTNNIKGFILNKTLVAPDTHPGPIGQVATLVVADTPSTNDSIMVSDLGRFSIENDSTSDFVPADKTTMRGVCAGVNGEFYSCAVPTAPDTTCPLTHTDSRTGIIYPIVNINGTCWFGTDLQYQELTTQQSNEFKMLAGFVSGDPESFNPYVSSGGNSLYNANYAYPSGSGGVYFSNTSFPTLTAKCESLLTNPLFGFNVGYFGGFNSATPDFSLTCTDGNLEVVTIQYIQSTGDGYDYNPGTYFLSDMVTKGACPSGWHIPTDAQWIEMETFFGMNPNVINKFTNSLYTGNPVTGITLSSSGSSTPYLRTVLNTVPKLIEMSFNQGNHSYFMRDRTTLTFQSNGATPTAHMSRVISQNGLNTVFERLPLVSNIGIRFVYNSNPISFSMRLARLFINVAEAFVSSAEKGKIRCVQGDAPVTRSIGSWGECANSVKTRPVSCYAGSYQIHMSHCDELYGPTTTSQACISGVVGHR